MAWRLRLGPTSIMILVSRHAALSACHAAWLPAAVLSCDCDERGATRRDSLLSRSNAGDVTMQCQPCLWSP